MYRTYSSCTEHIINRIMYHTYVLLQPTISINLWYVVAWRCQCQCHCQAVVIAAFGGIGMAPIISLNFEQPEHFFLPHQDCHNITVLYCCNLKDDFATMNYREGADGRFPSQPVFSRDAEDQRVELRRYISEFAKKSPLVASAMQIANLCEPPSNHSEVIRSSLSTKRQGGGDERILVDLQEYLTEYARESSVIAEAMQISNRRRQAPSETTRASKTTDKQVARTAGSNNDCSANALST